MTRKEEIREGCGREGGLGLSSGKRGNGNVEMVRKQGTGKGGWTGALGVRA